MTTTVARARTPRRRVAAGVEARGGRVDGRWLVPAVFAVVVGVTMSRHELWRDELQAWLLVRDSTTVGNLLHNIRYEGHPMLWYLVLLPLSKLGRTPGLMQAAQLCIATATVALVAFRAPFTRLQTWLFAAGYFVLYEFGVMSRSYSLGFLLVAVTCMVATTRYRWPWCGVTLVLAALTSAFASLVVVAITAGLLLDEIVRRSARDDEHRPAPLAAVIAGTAMIGAGLLVSYAQAAPPGDAGVYKSWKTSFDAAGARSALAAISRAIIPMPKLTREFWNTSVFDGITPLAAILGLVLLAGIAWALRDRPGACITWVATVGLVVGFLYSKIQYANASRHYGHIFIGLVAALWLAPSMAAWTTTRPAVRTRSALFTGILAVQAIAGLFVLSLDLRYPFSNGREMATYVKQHHLERSVIVAEHDYTSLTVAAYLDHDLYYLAGRRFGQQIVWNADRVDDKESLAHALRRFAQQHDRPVLLLANQPIHRQLRDVDLELLHAAHDGLVADEHFWLYRVADR